MYKRVLIIGTLLVSFSVLFFLAALYYRTDMNIGTKANELLFATTLKNADVDKIRIHTKNYELTLVKENAYWKIFQADFYYADAHRLEKLFELINTAQETECLQQNDKPLQDKVTISTYAQGLELDSYAFGGFDKYNQHRYYQKNGTHKICLTTANPVFPENLYAWAQQPLMQVAAADVAAVKITNGSLQTQSYIRPAPGFPLLNAQGREADLRNFFDIIGLLTFTDVKSAQNFDNSIFSQSAEIEITLFSGLVYRLKLFKAEQQYWLTQTLSSLVLSNRGISDYIKANAFLYDSWYFRLPPSKAAVLAETAGLD